MNPNIQPGDRVKTLAAIDPDATAASTVTTSWVSVAMYGSILATVMAGTLGTDATIDAKLEQATDSSGTGAKDITGKAITQLTQAGTDDSDQQATISCMAEELDIANDFDHVRLSITVGTATSDIGGLLQGFDARYEPGTAGSSVAEEVA